MLEADVGMEILEKAGDALLAIKEKRPLIHHITNYVTMNDCANIVLAVGGSPIMANDPAEVEEVTSAASALVLNMGTPNAINLESMIAAGKVANEKKVPVVFDPVGAGLTSFRRAISSKILDHIKPDVIRGNMAEIMYLSGLNGCSKGVDFQAADGNGIGIAKNLAKGLGCIVALTGKEDVVTDGRAVYLINNGTEALSRVTGTGCMTSSLVGIFCSVTRDYLLAAAAGVMSMGIAGQLAFAALSAGEGIGTFKIKLFDNIYHLGSETFLTYGDLQVSGRIPGNQRTN